MAALTLVGLFLFAAVIAIGSIGHAVSAMLPRARELKFALAQCPAERELRYTISETVVTPVRATVVALPMRFKQPVQPLRAAA